MAAPAFAVGFDTYYNGLGPLTLSVFGAGATLLGTLNIASDLNPDTGLADWGYLGFVSTAPIYGFQFDTTLGGQLNTGFTNISVAAVPEPTTWALIILGIAGVGFVGYRRSRKDQGLALASA